jgi:hypothetical protein|tara:strand:- start:32120 stop:32224 length:105 start_codon:yes stop_codon:yes gene_type:complete
MVYLQSARILGVEAIIRQNLFDLLEPQACGSSYI